MEDNRNERFYNKSWFMWLSLILFAPLGIFLLWKNHRFNTFARVALTLVFGLFFMLPFGMNNANRVAQNRTGQTEFSRVSLNYRPYSFLQWILYRFGGARTPGVPNYTFPTTSPAPVPITPWPTVPSATPVPNQGGGATPVPNQGGGATPAATVTPRPLTTPLPPDQGATEPTVPSATQTPAPTQTVGSNWKALQDKIFELTNVERQKNGLSNFVYNSAVEKYAVAKSQDMAQNNYFDHRSPTNGYFYDIWKRDGFAYSAGAENIYTMSDSRGFASRDVTSLAQSIVTAWMNSEGHRKNILNPNLKELGVGCAEQSNKLYATQLFYTR